MFKNIFKILKMFIFFFYRTIMLRENLVDNKKEQRTYGPYAVCLWASWAQILISYNIMIFISSLTI